MFRYLSQRIVVLLIAFFGITIIAFSLIRLAPGDPITLLLGERSVSEELRKEMTANLGFDKPLITQYFLFIYQGLQGDLGTSVITKRPVVDEFFQRLPATLELGIIALLFAITVGMPFGICAAVKRNSFFDYFTSFTSLAGYSMPIFWWGLVLIIIFSVHIHILPVSGRMNLMYDIEPITGFMLIDVWLRGEGMPAFIDVLKHLILPGIVMGTLPLAVITRMTRSSMLEILKEDYIRTAHAKGLTNMRVIGIHALRNALIPVITVIGLAFGSIITGAILTETIFSWPGIGRWLVLSVTQRDYPVIQGGIVIIASMIIMINILVDTTYAIVNPKMRKQT